jgi:beta-galactosidase
MKTISRRELLKSSLLAPAAVAAGQGTSPVHAAVNAASEELSGPLTASLAAPSPEAGRERLLLDFGWRFHFGHACDSAKDFEYGTAGAGNYQKTGNFMPAASASFDDGDWRDIDLPHDWAVELPYQNDAELQSKGFHPLGRKYPETSVGWYRRIFDLPAEDAGKRITLEFDGAYRNTMVVFNGFYIGRHSGGYDPFSFDVTTFANAGKRNVLLVRVDATESDGWFYEGAGIYRHVWLVKTHPVHVRQWGTFVRSEIRGDSATLSVMTEVLNHGADASKKRVMSTVIDPAGKAVAKDIAAAASIEPGNQQEYKQKIEMPHAKLWSV